MPRLLQQRVLVLHLDSRIQRNAVAFVVIRILLLLRDDLLDLQPVIDEDGRSLGVPDDSRSVPELESDVRQDRC